MSLLLDLSVPFAERPTLKVKATLTPGCVGLFGPSGVGKTTILRAIAGFPSRARGTITWRGRTLLKNGEWKPEHFTPPEQRRIAIVSQPTHLFPHLSAYEQVLLAARHGSKPLSETEILQLLADFELSGRETHRPDQLSFGECQRLALTRALASNPTLLLLDEAFTALDNERRARLLGITRDHLQKSEIACVLVSHDPRILQALAPETLVLGVDGTCRQGPTAEVLSSSLNTTFNVFSASVLTSDQGGLMKLEAEGCTLFSTARTLVGGESAVVSIGAEDIIVAQREPGLVSARNSISVHLVSKAQLPDGRWRLLTETQQGARFFVDLSQGALEELAIETGEQLFLLFKANRVEHIV